MRKWVARIYIQSSEVSRREDRQLAPILEAKVHKVENGFPSLAHSTKGRKARRIFDYRVGGGELEFEC